MKIYAIHSSADNWHPEISFFQTVMFHGEAMLPPKRAGIASHEFGERRMVPMRLIVNGFQPSDVFMPTRCCNLVVSERVRQKLEPLRRGFEFLPVCFEKVYNLPWPMNGEKDFELSPTVISCLKAGREFSISSEFPHDPGTAVTMPPCFEVVAHNHFPLLKQFPPTHQFFTEWFEEPVDNQHDLLPVSRKMFQEIPITCPGCTIVRDDIFEAIAPFLNKRFFGIKEFSFD